MRLLNMIPGMVELQIWTSMFDNSEWLSEKTVFITRGQGIIQPQEFRIQEFLCNSVIMLLFITLINSFFKLKIEVTNVTTSYVFFPRILKQQYSNNS